MDLLGDLFSGLFGSLFELCADPLFGVYDWLRDKKQDYGILAPLLAVVAGPLILLAVILAL
jgi:hypothetical protein